MTSVLQIWRDIVI